MFAKAGVRRRSQHPAVGVVTKQGGQVSLPLCDITIAPHRSFKEKFRQNPLFVVFQFVFNCGTAPILPPSGKARPSSSAPADRGFPPRPGPAAGSLRSTFVRASGPIKDFTAFCTVSAAIRVHSAALIASSHQANYFSAEPPKPAFSRLAGSRRAGQNPPQHLEFWPPSVKRASEPESLTPWTDLFILSPTDRKTSSL